ncbi:MAG: transposase [Caldilinea sp. CFX5]|nr:transposase [Caldilinea sp. CFX5]
MQKAFKFRIYPTEEQKVELAKQFGHARFVYNAALDLRKTMFFDHGVSFTYFDCADVLTQVKRDRPELSFLREANAQVLQQSLKDLDKAFSRYFDMCNGKLPKPLLNPGQKPRKDGMPLGYPTFKRKFDKQSIRFPQDCKLDHGLLFLPKVGWLKINRHRRIEGKLRNVTVSKTKAGKYFAAIQCLIETDIQPTENTSAVGIDLGLKDFAILSTGEKIEPPKHLRKAENGMVHELVYKCGLS